MAAYKREMVRHQAREVRKGVPAENLVLFFKNIVQLHSPAEITFVCIGTDRSTGDALGPLTGSLLQESGMENVIGTLSSLVMQIRWKRNWHLFLHTMPS